MEKSSQSQQQYSLANMLLAFYYVVGAVVALFVCAANGEPGIAMGVLSVFGLQALVIALGSDTADAAPAILRMRELRLDDSAPKSTVRELATPSKCWQFWPKSGSDKELATRSNCWKFWPDNSQTHALAQ